MKKIIIVIAILLNIVNASEIADNENTQFRIKSTFVYDIEIKDTFAIINIKRASFRLDKKFKNKEEIVYLIAETGYYKKKPIWTTDLYSNKLMINKFINNRETLIIENKKLYIPLSSIGTTLNKHWLIFTVATKNKDKTNDRIGFCHTHNYRKLHEYVKLNK